jgi:hypothetical protein
LFLGRLDDELRQAPAMGLVEHLADGRVERLPATGGLDRAAKMVGVALPLNAVHRRSPSPTPAGRWR